MCGKEDIYTKDTSFHRVPYTASGNFFLEVLDFFEILRYESDKCASIKSLELYEASRCGANLETNMNHFTLMADSK